MRFILSCLLKLRPTGVVCRFCDICSFGGLVSPNPREYLIQLRGGQNMTDGAAFLHFKVGITPALDISGPVNCREIIETHHALDMLRAEKVL